jgi:hypothetical protein
MHALPKPWAPCYTFSMTKTQALSYICSTFALLDEGSAAELADFAASLVQPEVPLTLTTQDRTMIKKSREDFKMGRTLTSAQYKKEMSAFWPEMAKKYPTYA